MTAASPVRVRFAPSPTGRFHIGGARTALYDYLLARQTGGQFVLRIEDTDEKRFVPGAEEEIMRSLRWLGLEWDEGPDVGGPAGPYRQSERVEFYRDHGLELVERGHAYYCFCTPDRLARVRKEQQQRKEPPRYDGLCRRLSPGEALARRDSGEPAVVRFKTPSEGQTTAHDLLRGPITIENANLDDYILIKSDGLPVYHLAAMVDDHLMGITHVLRGSEWLPTFPLHVLIYQAFEWQQPVWVHLSVFLNPSGKGKLSKRHADSGQGGANAVFALDLKEMGYLPEAVNNWVALMGWSYDDRTEEFTLDELTEKFSLDKLNPSPAAVNYSKLDHFNGLHIRRLSVQELSRRIQPFFESAGLKVDAAHLLEITPIIQERIRTLDEAVEIAGFFFRADVQPAPEELVGKGMSADASAQALERSKALLGGLTVFDADTLETALRGLADDLGLSAGQHFSVLRAAVTGQRVSPPLFESMVIIGRDTVLERIDAAVALLQQVDA